MSIVLCHDRGSTKCELSFYIQSSNFSFAKFGSSGEKVNLCKSGKYRSFRHFAAKNVETLAAFFEILHFSKLHQR